MTEPGTRQRDALLAAIHRATLAMKAATAEGRFELAMARLGRLLHERRLERRYNPNWPSQPRVPRGNVDGGQWTDGGVSGGEELQPGPFEEVVAGDMSPWPAATREAGPEAIPAAERPPLTPRPRLLNRHIRQEHVGRTDAELAERILARQVPGIVYFTGMDRTGSFDSIEAARDFIARTIDNNAELVRRVATGLEPDAFLNWRFGYRTGHEAVMDLQTGIITFRTTFNVGVYIVHDAGSEAGYRVVTGCPRNYNERIGQ